MSIYAVRWAYAQDVKPAGRKFVLVTIANFADSEGRAFPGVDTLAQMTGQDEKSVRRHIDALETSKYIRSEQRCRANGSRTTDDLWLLAPPEVLRPEAAPSRKKKQPDNLPGSEAPQQADNLPGSQADNLPGDQPDNLTPPTGQFDQTNRTICPEQADNLGGPYEPPLNHQCEPSVGTTTTTANDEMHGVGTGGSGDGQSPEAVEGSNETQQTPGGASAEAAHAASTGTANSDQEKPTPPASVNVDATSTEDVPAARRAALKAAFAPWKLERTLNKILGREADWLTIPVLRIQELHAEAVRRFKSRYRGDLEGMLDDEAQRLTASQPNPQDDLDIDDLFDAAPLIPVTNSSRSAK